jgi:malate synthase
VTITAQQILNIAATPGSVTEAGLRNDISVGIQYLQAWLTGTGAVAIFNLMEDAATAEIARSQVWQWLHNNVSLDDGRPVTEELVRALVGEEVAKLDQPERYAEARALFEQVALADEYVEFLTTPAYERIP